MTRQTAGPLDELRFAPTTQRGVRELVELLKDGGMSYDVSDVPYQRGNAWKLDQRIALIESWLRGLPVPAIVVNNRGYAQTLTYAVIDGKQRLMTARMWLADEFAVPASWFDPEFLADPFEILEGTPAHATYGDTGPYVYFSGLSVTGQRRFIFLAAFPLVEAHVPTVQEEARVYLLINGGGTAHTDEDMDRAVEVAARP